ncbi:hypothetical protein BFP75_11195 [Maribacter sp. 4G9]|nr:hypothetical protein BFP75_11195 [Maribacter sp. 4G9]
MDNSTKSIFENHTILLNTPFKEQIMKNIYHSILSILMLSFATTMQGQEKIQAPKVQSVKISNTDSSTPIGHFQEISLGIWESVINGQNKKYEEQDRDEWSIYLKDYDTDEAVSLNLWLNKVNYNGVTKYVVVDTSSDAIMDKPTPITAIPQITSVSQTSAPNNMGEQAIAVPNATGSNNSDTNKTDITDYIKNLNYDARTLLAVPAEGSFETLPPGGKTERKPFGNKVIKCVKKQNKTDETLNKVSILNPNAGVVYPGALILGDKNLAEGMPTPITLPRASVVLTVDLPGMAQGITIEDPKNSTIQNGIVSMLEKWNQNPKSQGYINPAKFTKRVKKAYSSEQLAVELGFSVDWAGNSASALMKVNTNSENEVTVAFFQQVFYTITMDAPQRPSDVFDTSKVTQADVSDVFSNQKPPAYVRSVDYGRVVMVRMETTKKATKFELEAALKYAVDPTTTIDIDIKSKYDGIWENSTYTVFAMGGSADIAGKFVAGNDIKGLQELIETDAVYSRNNPGVPIAYTVAWLKDNVSAGIKVSSNYVETECTEYDNAEIKLEHAGAYVARVTVQWSEPDANGILQPKKEEFGEQTAGWTKTMNFPGDAVNININAEAATGLVWAPWGEIMNKTLPGPSNCTYKMYGTTLDRRFEEKDCKQ